MRFSVVISPKTTRLYGLQLVYAIYLGVCLLILNIHVFMHWKVMQNKLICHHIVNNFTIKSNILCL